MRGWSELTKMVVGAAIFAVALFGSGLFMLAHGIGPAEHLRADLPATTNPETTAPGSEPIYGSRCEFVRGARLGAACIFLARNAGGSTAGRSFLPVSVRIDVPARWLSAQPDGTAQDDVAVVAALLRTGYSPAYVGHALSVDPAYGARLAQAGVKPVQLLEWLYRRAPAGTRPPWVPGGGG